MSGQTSGSLIILIIMGLISWYYFNKFQESEKNYRNLYYQFEKVHIDNKNMKIRIQDLESYKNDISKTFNVLDKELLVINDHLQRRNNNDNITKTSSGSANVQIMTPELINSLLDESEKQSKIETTNKNIVINDNVRLEKNDTTENENEDENNIIMDENELQLDENELHLDENELHLDENISDLEGKLENGGYHSDVELEHLNFRLGDNYNRFLINN